MATKRISELPTADTLDDNCCFPVVSGGTTKRALISLLKSVIAPPSSLRLYGQCSSADLIVQMADSDAYNRIKAAHESGKRVELQIDYYSDIHLLQLVTIGTDYYSFAAVTGYFSAPSHYDSASLNNVMVTVYSDGIASVACSNIFDR